MVRNLSAEVLGTSLLVYIAVGMATLSFGFGTTGLSFAAGVVATALAFGLVLLVLAYVIGPVSGCHINPAVTIGVWLTGRIALAEAVGYWVAQFVGGILGAFLVEVVLTAVFVFAVLQATSRTANVAMAGMVVGFALTLVHLIGIPITGTSVNPDPQPGAGPDRRGTALSQVWLSWWPRWWAGPWPRVCTGCCIRNWRRPWLQVTCPPRSPTDARVFLGTDGHRREPNGEVESSEVQARSFPGPLYRKQM